ncbi:hypothetical protein N665_0661s0002 [Sinapis alba]|nr:hypothetical protein N665_0661s0002 [Sinapis alba]
MVMIPVTLKGANYLLWARLANTALGGRGLWDVVEEGKNPKKTILGEDGKEVVVADAGDKKRAYSYCETSKELWDTLKKVYGNQSIISRVFEVKRAINTLSQEDIEFDRHFGNFRSLWAELEMLRPGILDPDVLNERREQDKVFALLFTLNSGYNDLIKHILRKKSHGKDKCWILHPHLKPRKFSTPYADARAHFSGEVGEPSTPKRTMAAGEGKPLTFSGGSAVRTAQDETIKRSDIDALIKILKENSGNTLGISLNASYNSPTALVTSTNASSSVKLLVIDSGASHHMISDARLISNVEPVLGNVMIANRDKIPIKCVGTLQLFDKDTKAFYMPTFASNLLSVKRVTTDFNCNVIFSSNEPASDLANDLIDFREGLGRV